MPTTITKIYDPYNWETVNQIHRDMTRDFGRLGLRWRLKMIAPNNLTTSAVPRTYEYTFENPHDAMIYSIKYSER